MNAINAFKFARLPEILFGHGMFFNISDRIKQVGKNVLLVTGNRSFTSGSKWPYLLDILKKSGVTAFHEVIAGEPSPLLVDQLRDKYKNKNINVLVAIGGGSVMDAGKAVSAMLTKEVSVMNYLEGVGTGEVHDGKKIPFIAIPTTSGTGSEATKNAVLSQVGETGFKKSLRHDHFVPDIAIVDPELTLNCPPDLTASCGMDAFSQLLESYLSVNASPFTDALAERGILEFKKSFIRSVEIGEDLNARTGMSLASLISGITLANAGLGLGHGFASPMGGFFNIPHGVVCGTLLAECNKANINKLKLADKNSVSYKKYLFLGNLFSENTSKTDDFYLDFFAEYLEDLVTRLNLPRLSHYGLTESDLEKIARHTDAKSNPVSFTKEEMLEVLKNRL